MGIDRVIRGWRLRRTVLLVWGWGNVTSLLSAEWLLANTAQVKEVAMPKEGISLVA